MEMRQTDLVDFFGQAFRYASIAQEERNRFVRQEGKTAAVLLAVVRREGQWQIVLTRRADTLRHHTGQIAFAGGRSDEGDKDFIVTALRETEEETGIAPHFWQVFPPLPPYYTPSGYEVHPVLALCPENPPTCVNSGEVAEIFYLPLDFALDMDNYGSRSFIYEGNMIATPVLPYLHYDIWGLTALILYGLAERYQYYCAGRKGVK